jgi:hypothetical protein
MSSLRCARIPEFASSPSLSSESNSPDIQINKLYNHHNQSKSQKHNHTLIDSIILISLS